MGNPQTITLNGKQYDALTGKLIASPEEKKPTQHHLKKASEATHHKPRNIDGFVGGIKNKNLSKPAQVIAPNKQKSNDEPKPKHHEVAPHTKRLTEKSKTLMRSVVHKPDISGPGPKAKIKHPTRYRERLSGVVASGVSAAQPAKEALANRAQAIQKSNLVTRFGDLTQPPKTVEPDPNLIQTTANSEVHLKNLEMLAQQETAPATEKDVFEEAALKLANSYQTIKRKHTPFYTRLAKRLHIKTKTLIICLISLAVVILLGLFFWIFMNNIRVYIADQRSGIHASLPDYTPSGFELSSVNYAGGTNNYISLGYKSNSDSRNYTLKESPSTTDSQGLISTTIQPAVGSNYKTYQVGGRTVYFYNNHEIWVDSGIYFDITNNANLPTDQLLQIINGI